MNRVADPAFTRTLFFIAFAGAVLNFIAFYPGILHHDAWAYFWQARDGRLDNWQPPLLGYLWVPLQKIYYGPQPMLALFCATYWIGFFLLARAYAAAEGRKIGGWILAAAFFPMALNFTGILVKDIAMSDCFLLAAGVAIAIELGAVRKNPTTIALMWIFLIAGAFMRANALFAMPPLLDLALILASTRWAAIDWKKRAIAACLLATLFVPAHTFADKYIFRAEQKTPISPLQVFDLGGITYFSNQDVFNGFFGPDFVERNKTCYSPQYWDVYGWLRCPEVYENLKPKFGLPLTETWVKEIFAHPIAYLQHRLSHFNSFMQFACKDCKQPIDTGIQSTNQNEFSFSRGPLFQVIYGGAQLIDASPLGPPYVWLALCLAWSIAAFGIPHPATRYATMMLTLSGAMYSLAFVVVGIASDYRYIDWTMLCALIATPAIIARVFLCRDAPIFLRFAPALFVIALILFREFTVRVLL